MGYTLCLLTIPGHCGTLSFISFVQIIVPGTRPENIGRLEASSYIAADRRIVERVTLASTRYNAHPPRQIRFCSYREQNRTCARSCHVMSRISDTH